MVEAACQLLANATRDPRMDPDAIYADPRLFDVERRQLLRGAGVMAACESGR